MKIWFDDIRKPPSSKWIWARTVDECISLMHEYEGSLEELSLDHDLGLDHLDPDMIANPDYLRGYSDETGLAVARYLADKPNLAPSGLLVIHSWNLEGAKLMALVLRKAGLDPVISPFEQDWRFEEDEK